MRKNENKVLIILSVGNVISLFFIIRECTYLLVWDTAILRLLFVPHSNERVISNIAFSYVAAYIFYIMQVYIPKILNRKKIYEILGPKVEEFIFKISELSFVMEQICYQCADGISVNRDCLPIYYKITVNNAHNIKKVSEINTLLEMQRQIEDSYAMLLERFVIYNLDVSVLELWEEIPLDYYRGILQITKQNEGKQMPIIIKGIGEGDKKSINHIKSIFGIRRNIQFEKTNKQDVKDKYERLARQSSFQESILVLRLEEDAHVLK